MFIVFILLLIGLYVILSIHDEINPNDVPKVDNFWEIDERLRKYKDECFLETSMWRNGFR